MRWLPLLAMTWAGVAAAQSPVVVYGVVRDGQTGAAVPDAEIQLGERTGTSDADGSFRLGGVAAGRVELVARAPGYAPDRRWLDLVPGMDLRLALTLMPRPWQLDSLTVTPQAPLLAISGDQLSGRGTDLARALDGWAGLVVRRSGSGGPATPQLGGGSPDELLVIIDGFPANDPLTGRADLGSLSTGEVARVSLEPGAQGARAGSRAIAGVLRIETRRDVTPEASLTVAPHGAGSARIAATVGRGTIMVRRETFANGFAYDIPAVRGSGEAERVNSDGSRWAFNGGWRGGLTATVRATVSDQGIPGIVTNPTPSATASDRSVFIGARGGRQVEAEGSVEWLRTRARDPMPPSGPAYDATTEGIGLRGTIILPHRVILGQWGGNARLSLEGRHDAYRGDGIRQGARFDRGTVAWHATLTRGDARWSVAPALRVDWWTGADPVASGRLDAAWTGNGTTLTAGVGSAVTAPVLTDLFFREGVGVAVNPGLRPERVRWEVQAGIARHGLALGMPVEGSLRLHYGRVEDMILWSPDFRFVWSPRNFDVRRGGAGIVLRAKPRANIGAGATATWTPVTYIPSGTQVQYRPRSTMSADVSWTPGPWRTDLRWHRIGRRYPNGAGQNPLPPINLLDAGLERRLTPYAALRLDVQDLLDEKATYIAGYPTPGRSAALTLTVNLP